MQNTQIDPQNHEQQLAYELVVNTNSSFFLTGRAGTGKTTFLHNVQKLVGKQFITLAPTGVAAILAGGDTIHSFFGLPMEVCTSGTCGKMNEARILTLLHADTIIIDEVSMVRCDVMDAIDYTMRKALRNNMPFGGKQMIFVGDMFQLPPVVKQGPEKDLLKDLYHTDDFFFYKSDAIKRLRLVKIEFQKVYRQEDAKFLSTLNRIRNGICLQEDLDQLNSRMQECNDKYVITLSSVNAEADKLNKEELDKLDTPAFTYEALIEKEFNEKKYPVKKSLTLKVGAQVMMCRNDSAKRWANGSIGIITHLENDKIEVEFENGQKHQISRTTWENCNYKYNKKEMKTEKEVTGTFTQYPIRLAWAITIHKSQGLTFSKMKLNLNRGIFQVGQLYVALSRVKSLEGLFLSSAIKPTHIKPSGEIMEFAKGFNNEKQLQNEYDFSKVIYPLLHQGKYDEASEKCLELIAEDAKACRIKEAINKIATLLDIVIDDSVLLHKTCEVPVIENNSICANFINAIICLYGDRYEEAISYANQVLAQKKECKDAMYIQARAYALKEDWKTADEIHSQIFAQLKERFDAKYFFAASVVNELHTPDNGLNIMQYVINRRPNYLHGVVVLRKLMQRKDLRLENESQETNSLVDAFNSDISSEEFLSKIEKTAAEASKIYNELIDIIIGQDL